MRFLIVSCKVFEGEIKRILGDNHKHSIVMLDFGYHRRPVLLQQKLQHIIDSASGVDAVLLVYGYCGGSLKLDARNLPVIIPRVHDCFDIMLGVDRRFRLFSEEPGTYFLSEGWVRKDGTPIEKIWGIQKRLKNSNDKILNEIYAGYKRIVFVKTGVETVESILRARHAAVELGWRFIEEDSNLDVMKKLFSGQWDRDFIILNPQKDERFCQVSY